MTRLAFTAPIDHLEDFEDLSDFTFGLSFLLSDDRYRRWLEGRGGLVILDNSFNETQVPATVDQVVEWYKDGLANIVVQPDADNWSSDEMHRSYCLVAEKIGVDAVMGIYRNAKERQYLKDIGARHVALSYWWRRSGYWPIFADFSDTHFLGLGPLSSCVGNPKSLDTTQPVKWAFKGLRFDEWDGTYVYPTTTDLRSDNRLGKAWSFFGARLSDDQVDLARANCEGLRRALRSGLTVPPSRSPDT